MHTKEFRAAVKAAGEADGLTDGQFTALVSVFGNVDSMGDVVKAGAFAEDLGRWEKSGDPIPVVWSHDWSNPFSHIGYVVKAEETGAGLKVTGQLDLENPTAMQVYRLLKGRRVTQFSFAYDVEDAGWETVDGTEAYALKRLKLHEVGPCLVGVNQETELLAAKAADVARGQKAGRVLSQKNYDRLVEARDALDSVISAAAEQPKSDEKTSEPDGSGNTDEPSQAVVPPAVDEEPDGAKSTAATTDAPRRASAEALIRIYALKAQRGVLS
jgi:HK97 family phage prohead protease